MMEIISSKEALERGLLFYFTGRPCKHGHVTQRVASSRSCVECVAEASRKHNKAHPEAKAAACRKYRAAHPEAFAASCRKHREANRESRRACSKRFYDKNPEYFAEKKARRVRGLKQRTIWGHAEVLSIRRQCSAITKATGVLHHVDHIVPLKGKLVCGLHVPENLRIITATENLSKSNRYDPATS